MTSRHPRLIYVRLTSAKKTKVQSAHGSFIYKRLKHTTRYCRLSTSDLPHITVIYVVPKMRVFMSLCFNINSNAVITDCEDPMMTSRHPWLIFIRLIGDKKTKVQSAHGSFIYKRLKHTSRYCRLSTSDLPHLTVMNNAVPKMRIFMSLCFNINSAVRTDCEDPMTSRHPRLIYVQLTSAKKTKVQPACGSFIYKRLKHTTR